MNIVTELINKKVIKISLDEKELHKLIVFSLISSEDLKIDTESLGFKYKVFIEKVDSSTGFRTIAKIVLEESLQEY